MLSVYLVTIIFIYNLIILYPITKKPLYNDDGNFLSYAVFKGTNPYHDDLYKVSPNLSFAGIEHIFAVFSRIFRTTKPGFFQWLQVVWISLTATGLTYYVFLLTGNIYATAFSAILMTIVMLSERNCFYILLGETYSLLPFVLVNIAIEYFLQTNNFWFLFIAGIFVAWMNLIKITNLPFLFFFTILSLVFGNLTGLLYFFCGVVVLLIMANLWVAIKFSFRDLKTYNIRYWQPLIILIYSLFKIKKKEFENTYVSNMRTNNSARPIQKMKAKNIKIIWEEFGALFLIAITATMFNLFDYIYLIHFAYFIIFILILRIQNFYFITKFNPMLIPLVVISSLFYDNITSRLSIGFKLAIMLIFLFNFRNNFIEIFTQLQPKNHRKIFGFKHFADVLELCRNIGERIYQLKNNKNDTLVVWGNLPNINIYAQMPTVFRSMTFMYPARKPKDKKELRNISAMCRDRVPKFYVDASYFMKDKWTIDDFSFATGIPYRALDNYQLIKNGRVVNHVSGKKYEFPLFVRNDELYKDILLYNAISGYTYDYDKVFQYFRLRKERLSEKSIFPNYRRLADKKATEYYIEKFTYLFGKQKVATFIESLQKVNSESKIAEINSTLNTTDISDEMKTILQNWKGYLLLSQKNYQAAEDCFKIALDNKKNYFSHLQLGNIYAETNQLEKAKKSYEKGIKLNNLNEELFNNLGVIYAYLGFVKDAKILLKHALKLNPTYQDAQKNLNHIQNSEG